MYKWYAETVKLRGRAKYSSSKLCPGCIQQIVKSREQTKVKSCERTKVENRIRYVGIAAGPYPSKKLHVIL
jgi:hypothetical protein